jgi:hypothetical protein|tara:strand:- start:424 stop:570 length:147 start_codon:yes stop_codon:yes gene_type:complete
MLKIHWNIKLNFLGCRPFIGWICGFALAYNFIIRDLAIWAIGINDVPA